MVRTRVTHAMIVALVLSLLLAPGALAEVRPPTDGQELPGATLAAPPQSPRLIVELASPPLAAVFETEVAAASVNGRLDTDAPRHRPMSASYRLNRPSLSVLCKRRCRARP